MTGQAQDMARRRMHKIIMGSWDGCDGASAHFYRAATTWPATRTRQSTVLPMGLEASHAASAPGIESRELLDCFCTLSGRQLTELGGGQRETGAGRRLRAVHTEMPATAAHEARAFHYRPAERPMMAIMNPSRVLNPKAPARAEGRRKAELQRLPPTRRQQPMVPPLILGPTTPTGGVPAGAVGTLDELLLESMSCREISLPAIEQRPEAAARSARHLPPSFRNAPPTTSSPATRHSSVSRGVSSPAHVSTAASRLSSGDVRHTWIEPLSSPGARPGTRDGKETAQGPEHKIELEVLEVLAEEDKFCDEATPGMPVADTPPETPLQTVPGIGSVSVQFAPLPQPIVPSRDNSSNASGSWAFSRLADGWKQVPVEKSIPRGAPFSPSVQSPWGQQLSQDARVVCAAEPTSRSDPASVTKPAGLGQAAFARTLHKPQLERQCLDDTSSQVEEEPAKMLPRNSQQTRLDTDSEHASYLETPAYVASNPPARAAHDGLVGTGFSRTLTRFANPRSRIFHYPSSSQALNSMSLRPHQREGDPSHAIAMGICRPPAIDQTYYTLKQMKRQWLMQYSQDPPLHQASAKAQRKTGKRLREDDLEDIQTDRFVRSPHNETKSSLSAAEVSPLPTSTRNVPAPTSREKSVHNPRTSVPESMQNLMNGSALLASKSTHGYTEQDREMLKLHAEHNHDKETGEVNAKCVASPGAASVWRAHPGRDAEDASPKMHNVMELSPIGETSFEDRTRDDDSLALRAAQDLSESHMEEGYLDSPQFQMTIHKVQIAVKNQSPAARLANEGAHTSVDGQSPVCQGHEIMEQKIETEEYSSHATMSLEDDYSMGVFESQRSFALPHVPVVSNFNTKNPSKRKLLKKADMQIGTRRIKIAPEPPLIREPQAALGVVSDVPKRRRTEVSPHTSLRLETSKAKNETRKMIIREEMHRKQFMSEGNRALLRCEADLDKMLIKRAITNHTLACTLYKRANAFKEKKHHLDELHHRIVQVLQEYHDFIQEETDFVLTPVPPEGARAAASIIRVPIRGPDCLQPDGMQVQTRHELEDRRRKILEEERTRREGLLDEAQRLLALERKRKEVEARKAEADRVKQAMHKVSLAMLSKEQVVARATDETAAEFLDKILDNVIPDIVDGVVLETARELFEPEKFEALVAENARLRQVRKEKWDEEFQKEHAAKGLLTPEGRAQSVVHREATETKFEFALDQVEEECLHIVLTTADGRTTEKTSNAKTSFGQTEEHASMEDVATAKRSGTSDDHGTADTDLQNLQIKTDAVEEPRLAPQPSVTDRMHANVNQSSEVLQASILQACCKRVLQQSSHAEHVKNQGVAHWQSVIRSRSASLTFVDQCANACILEARLRSHRESKIVHVALLSSRFFAAWAARRTHGLCLTETPMMQGVFRRRLVEPNLSGLRAFAAVLQTFCRRQISVIQLPGRAAYIFLEPLIQRAVWNHKLLSKYAAGATLSGAISNRLLVNRHSRQKHAAKALQLIAKRNAIRVAYFAQIQEVWRMEDEGLKRRQMEEIARQRAEQVSLKQKEIMEQMEGKNRMAMEEAKRKAAEEAERMRMLAGYSRKSVDEESQQTKKKKDALERRKKLAPAKKSENELFALAVHYERQQQYLDAIKALESIMKESPPTNDFPPALKMACLLKRGTCLGKLGMKKDCLRDFHDAIAKFPGEHLPLYMRALHHIQWKNDELAMRDVDATLDIEPDHAESLNIRASLALKNGFYVDAISVASRALEIKPDLQQLYIIRGMAQERLGMMPESADDLEAAINMALHLHPTVPKDMSADDAQTLFHTLNDNVLMTFCDACLEDKSIGAQRVINVLSNVIEFSGRRSVLFALRGRALCDIGKFTEAQQDFDKAMQTDDASSCAHILLAQFKRASDPSGAIQDCIKATEIDPNNVRAHAVLGKLYQEQNQSRDALASYKKALAAASNAPGAYEVRNSQVHYESCFQVGTLQFKISESDQSMKQEAFRQLRDSSRLHAPNISPLIQLARFLEAGGNYREAIKVLSRMIHQSPADPRNYVLRSQCLLQLGERKAALKDRQCALKLDQRANAEVLEVKITDCLMAKRNVEALAKIQEAMKLHPENAHFKILQARLFHTLGRDKEAKREFDAIVNRHSDEAEVFEARAEFLLDRLEFSHAIDDFERCIDIDPFRSNAHAGRGDAKLKLNRTSSAHNDLNFALQQDPENLRALSLSALALERDGDSSGALRTYARILSLVEKPKEIRTMQDLVMQEALEVERKWYSFEAHIKSGILHTKRRDYAGAIEHYNYVLKIEPRCFKALLHRGVAFHSHGYHESAISDYDRALAVEPGNSTVLRNRAKAFAFQRKWKQAVADIEGIKDEERDTQVFTLLASCYCMMHDPESALVAINQALQMDGLSLNSLISKADILEQIYPASREAMSAYSRALGLFPYSQLARLKHALAMAKRGFADVAIKKINAARVHAEEGSPDGPENCLIRELGAMILMECAMPMSARTEIDRLLENRQATNRCSLLTARGVLHQRQGDMVMARADFARAVQADPTDADAHYNLGCQRLEDMDWRGAYKAFTRTIFLKPKDSLVFLNRGVSLYQMHRISEAMRDFNSALELQPDCVQALLNRGVVHQIEGSNAEAEKDFSRALEILDGSKEALECRANFYQNIGRKDRSLEDNARLLAITDPD